MDGLLRSRVVFILSVCREEEARCTFLADVRLELREAVCDRSLFAPFRERCVALWHEFVPVSIPYRSDEEDGEERFPTFVIRDSD